MGWIIKSQTCSRWPWEAIRYRPKTKLFWGHWQANSKINPDVPSLKHNRNIAEEKKLRSSHESLWQVNQELKNCSVVKCLTEIHRPWLSLSALKKNIYCKQKWLWTRSLGRTEDLERDPCIYVSWIWLTRLWYPDQRTVFSIMKLIQSDSYMEKFILTLTHSLYKYWLQMWEGKKYFRRGFSMLLLKSGE